ncbi:MAG: hypothetical protein ABTR07_04180 [Candidatus Competibacter denitrificans]
MAIQHVACTDCGQFFTREDGEEWKTRCLSCFKKQKRVGRNGQVAASPAPALERISVQLLRVSAQRWQEQFHEANAECQRLKGKLSLLELRQEYQQEVLGTLREMLPRLRQLCHPDRHSNSTAANIATTWLNTLKEKLP